MKKIVIILLISIFPACVEPLSNSLQGTEVGCFPLSDDPEFPKILTFGDPNSILWLRQLSDCKRRSLLIGSEGAAISAGDLNTLINRWYATKLIPMSLRFIKVPRGDLKITGYSDIQGPLDLVQEPGLLEHLSQETGVYLNHESVWIPIHPTTHQQHPLIQSYLDKGLALEEANPMGPTKVIGTMSRSLWYRPEQQNATIKMGTDFVNGRPLPNKLTDVMQDITDLQDIMQNTSIPQLISEIDVDYLADSKAIRIEGPGELASNPYAVALRDYSRLMQDHQRIYVPLALIQELTRRDKSCDNQYLIPYGFNRFIKFPQQKLEEMLYKLNVTLAQVIAIHHANGYMPIDFHGQNLMVGIPLNPQIAAKLVIRDVADIYRFQFDKTNASSWAGIKKIEARGVRLPLLDMYQAIAYKDQMKRIGFRIGELSWDQVPAQYTIKDIARHYYEYQQKSFWAEVTNFREKNCKIAKPKLPKLCMVRARMFVPKLNRVMPAKAGVN